MRAHYEFRILGPLEVRRDGSPLPIGATKLRVLLASLLVDADRIVSVDTLVGRLWGEDPPGGARKTLQNYVLRLRRALEADGCDLVRTHARGYSIVVGPDVLDLHRFNALVRLGRAALGADEPTERAAHLFQKALELWKGDPLSDLPADSFQDVVHALTEQRLDALELRINADIALGRARDVLPELRTLIGTHPLRESFWAQRIRALYQCGRQGEALECYHTVATLLAEELGVDPGAELRNLHRLMLAAAPKLDVAGTRQAPTAGNLPAETTTFIGRDELLAEARRTLEASRLVTLTGTGGVGKTRLALRLAAETASTFADGVWLADLALLAPFTRPEQLGRTIAESLGLRDQSARPPADAVAAHLRDRHLLLVLDNCEHLVESVAALAQRLLRSAPGLRILATSRERLGEPGEHVLLVQPLTLPGDPERGDDRSESVRLLAARAAAAAPGFGITDRNRRAVLRLCRRLDGIPLAIELAAVWLSLMTVEDILERLDDRFHMPAMAGTRTDGRYQQTLRGVFDWSHELCTEGERLLWARLSVFAGSFDLEAVETVCVGEGVAREEAVDLLAGLVRKSIVMADSSENRTRYRLLETIRRYGQQRLREGGDEIRLRIRHSDYYRGLASRASAEWCGPDEVDWLLRLRRELPNLREALNFCATHPGQAEVGLNIVGDLIPRFWVFSGTIGEARHWLDRLSALLDSPPGERDVAVMAKWAFLPIIQGDRPAVPPLMAACRAAAGSQPSAPALYIEGAHALFHRGDPASITLLSRARTELLAHGRVRDAHMATMFWAMAAAFLGQRNTAFHARDVYIAEAEATGGEWAVSWAVWCAGLAELRHGEPADALVPLREALIRQQVIGDEWGPVWDVEALAWTTAAIGHHRHAAVLLGAAHRMRQETGVALIGLKPFQTAHMQTERLVQGGLAEKAYIEARRQGSAAEDCIGLALTIVNGLCPR